jgi:23S rRNA pseudouridine1911/1915/1917 synthase
MSARRRARAAIERRGIRILAEDNHLLVLAKPAGLLSQGGPSGETSLVELVEAYRREAEGKSGRAFVGLVHRLDRNTSGVIVVAKTSKAAARLSRCFRERAAELEKTYLAWVVGRPVSDEGDLALRLAREGRVTRPASEGDEGAREARLSYRVEARSSAASRVRVRLDTGLPHQIRAQLAAAGHPLLGDPKYGGPPGPRLALHALSLAFPHPVGDAPLRFAAPVPSDLLALDRRLLLSPPLA